MCAQRDSGRSPLVGGLDAAFGFAIAAALLLGVLPTIRYGDHLEALTCLVLLGAATLLWLRRRQQHRTGWWTAGFSAVALGLTLVPDVAAGVVLMALLGVFVLAVEWGFTFAAAVTGLYAVAIAVEVAVLYDGVAADILFQAGGLGLLLILAAVVGHLVRTTDRARSDTEEARAELAAANVQLRRALLVEGELVLAEERARSARDLHDGLGHSLTLASMSLELAQRLRDRDPERAWAEVAEAARINAEALELMRQWVRALDPPGEAHTLGGRDAFEAIAGSFRGTGLDVRVRHRGEQHLLPIDASLFATRFLQEGLTNVLRHAEATVVEIDVQQSPHQLRLAISDDGCGLAEEDLSRMRRGDGFGLRSLRERAALLGGTVGTGRPSSGGFELTAVLPMATEGDG
ncbi:MAG: sensor histidine kinase [Nocardioides sp.]|uniref:sensor histidine kinase n=1 Tax=Nocardioides sp. TaxID=35761 RepID=UPI0039E3882E